MPRPARGAGVAERTARSSGRRHCGAASGHDLDGSAPAACRAVKSPRSPICRAPRDRIWCRRRGRRRNRPRLRPVRPAHGGQPLRPTLPGQPAAGRWCLRGQTWWRVFRKLRPSLLPGQPPAPRPGMPDARATAVSRAAAWSARSPPVGSGRTDGASRPGMRGRGLHPTTPVLEPPAPATDAGRRDAAKKRPLQRDREIDREGKLRTFGPRKMEPTPLPVIDREITISEGITVKEFADKLGVKASLVIKTLFERKIFATINQTLDVKMATEIALAVRREDLAHELRGRVGPGDRRHRGRGRPCHSSAGGHRHGTRRSRQDVAAGRDSRNQCRRARSRRHYAAHRRISRRDQRAEDRLHRYAGPRSLYRACAHAAPASPTSWCW